METSAEAVCDSFTCEETFSNNLITLPAELLVYIMSLLIIRDRIKLRYVSRRLRYVSEVAALWSEFLWPYFENRHEYCVCDTLKACGEHVNQLSFPFNVQASKLVWLTENCVNVTRLILPPRVYFHPAQLERIVCTMTLLQELDVCWSEHIKPLLEISVELKELTIRIKKFKSEPVAWQLEEWASEGISFPPVIRIFTKSDYCVLEQLYRLLSKHYSIFPTSELFLYSSAKVPMNFHPQLPLLRFKFGVMATSPVLKASNYGILGLQNDIMHTVKFNFDGKLMYGIVQSLVSGPKNKYLNLGFSTLSSIRFFTAGYHGGIFSGHLEQLAIACPNLRWLDLQGCCDCLQNLRGLQTVINMCQDLQGLNIADISVTEVESYVLLWQMLSSITKLSHLTLDLCLLMVPDHVHKQRMITTYQRLLSLQALEIEFGGCKECTECSIEDLLLSHFPLLIYCRLSYDNPNILRSIITTCKHLKYLCCDARAKLVIPQSCSCTLQQLCIESKYTDIPDSFMDMISMHGGLEHLILSVRLVTVKGIYTLIKNSPNLISFCVFVSQPLYNENGRKLQSKDFKAKVKKEFCHHKLFTAGAFRLAVGNQFFYQYDVLSELNTDLNSLWNQILF